MTKTILLGVAFLATSALSLAAGLALRTAPASTIAVVRDAAVVPITATIERAQLGAQLGSQLGPMIRDIVREELARGAAAAPTKPREEARSEPTAEQVEAFDRGHALVTAAHQAGHWTDDDRQQLHGLLNRLNSDDAQQLLRTLSVAINSQELKVDTLGPAF